MKKKLILLDIDHTIFDTNSFRKEFFGKIADLYKSAENIPALCDSLCNAIIEKKGFFDTEEFLKELLIKIGGQDYTTTIRQYILDEAIVKMHLHEDVMEALHKLGKLGTIGILSQGEDRYQRSKLITIEHLLGSEHIYISKDKKTFMSKIFNTLKDYDVFFVDDTLVMLYAAWQIDSSVRTIWMKRTNKKGMKRVQKEIAGFKPYATIEDLEEAAEIIKYSS